MGRSACIVNIEIMRLGDPAESELGPITGYVYNDHKCLGSIHQAEEGLIFVPGALTPLSADVLETLAEILNRWVN